jgi:hypothetical protein
MKKLLLLSVLAVFFGCASSPDVRPGLDGIHQVSTLGGDVNDTESDAYKQARSYCKDQGKAVEFLSDETFKATPSEGVVDQKAFKKNESVATDIKFKCV